MSRPQKSGVDYFPLDVGFYSDIKIKGLKARFGADGIAIYLYILCEVYRDKGYYLRVDDDFLDAMSDDLRMNDAKIWQVINFLLSRSLLNSTLFKSDKVLTSAGIQKRFQLAVKVRGKKTPIEIESKFWVLREEETESFIKVTLFSNSSGNNPYSSEKNPDNSEIYPQSKGKESKEKQSKVFMGGQPPPTQETEFIPPTLQEVTDYCRERNNNIDSHHFLDYYTASGWIDGKGNPVRNWRQKVIYWENNPLFLPPPSPASGASFDLDEIKAVMRQNTKNPGRVAGGKEAADEAQGQL